LGDAEKLTDKQPYLGRTKLRFEINATLRCNAVCKWCNRAVGVADFDETDVHPDQIPPMVEAMKRAGLRPSRVKIAGGEPLENPRLNEIVQALAPLNSSEGWILTNGTQKDRRKTVNLPANWKWHPSNLDGKLHEPFLVSPVDVGIRSTLPLAQRCDIQRTCGVAFDAQGFAMCGLAGTLGRLLRVNPYREEPVIDRQGFGDICKHCPYSLSEPMQRKLFELVYDGHLSNPSPTFREGIKRWKEEPVSWPRYAGVPSLEHLDPPPVPMKDRPYSKAGDLGRGKPGLPIVMVDEVELPWQARETRRARKKAAGLAAKEG
jgi:hypothetical protein